MNTGAVTMTELRALTVRQPWCSAMVIGDKRVENRSRRTRYRGMVALHAGLAIDWDAAPMAWTAAGVAVREAYRHPAWQLGLPLGAVIAVAELYGCHQWPAAGSCNGRSRPPCSPWASLDQWHWQLKDVRPLATPVPCRGMLGLWRLPDDAERAVRGQYTAAIEEHTR